MTHPLALGQHYCMRLPDGRSLGHVCIERLDGDYAEGPFEPAPAFDEFRALFDREARLRHDQVIPLWEETFGAIEALKIEVVADDAHTVSPNLRVFVEGNEAILGAPLTTG